VTPLFVKVATVTVVVNGVTVVIVPRAVEVVVVALMVEDPGCWDVMHRSTVDAILLWSRTKTTIPLLTFHAF